MTADFGIYGNASSMHGSGREARARIEGARRSVAALIGAEAGDIIFTSGGSEANNTVFQSLRQLASDARGVVREEGRNEFIVSAIEHPCVLNSARQLSLLGFKVIFLPVNAQGLVSIQALKGALSDKTLLVSIMSANNETGVIEPVREIAAAARAAGAYTHTDAVQAVGKIPVDVKELGVDYLTVSAHKIYGPKGVGALYHRRGVPLFPLIHGGHQEDGLRAGTYNNTGILGFGVAAALAKESLSAYRQHVSLLRDRLREGLLARVADIKINGPLDDGELLPNTLDVSFPGAEGEAILLALDLKGIEVSTGSACASGSLEPSHVLMATGVGPEMAHGSIRFSLGWGNSAGDIEYVLETLPPIIARLRAMSTLGTSV
jgi:cysteine desulfurase